MNVFDRIALWRAIAHWERLRDGRGRWNERPSVGDCALCDRFYATTAGSCVRFGLPWPPWRLSRKRRRRVPCPVAGPDGEHQRCRETPYREAHDAFFDAEVIRGMRGEGPSGREYDAMDREVRFLRGLL